MINFIPFLIKYRKYIAIGLAILGVLASIFFYGRGEYNRGYGKAKLECEIEKQETINDRLQTRQKQDRTMRPSDTIYLERLRGRSA